MNLSQGRFTRFDDLDYAQQIITGLHHKTEAYRKILEGDVSPQKIFLAGFAEAQKFRSLTFFTKASADWTDDEFLQYNTAVNDMLAAALKCKVAGGFISDAKASEAIEQQRPYMLEKRRSIISVPFLVDHFKFSSLPVILPLITKACDEYRQIKSDGGPPEHIYAAARRVEIIVISMDAAWTDDEVAEINRALIGWMEAALQIKLAAGEISIDVIRDAKKEQEQYMVKHPRSMISVSEETFFFHTDNVDSPEAVVKKYVKQFEAQLFECDLSQAPGYHNYIRNIEIRNIPRHMNRLNRTRFTSELVKQYNYAFMKLNKRFYEWCLQHHCHNKEQWLACLSTINTNAVKVGSTRFLEWHCH